MNEFDYQFMIGKWEGPPGAALWQTYEYCRNKGWFMGLSDHGEPIPTQKGTEAIEAYKKSLTNQAK